MSARRLGFAAAFATAVTLAACSGTDAPSSELTVENAAPVTAANYQPSRFLTFPHWLYSHAPQSGRLAIDLFNTGTTPVTAVVRFEHASDRHAILDPETITIEPGGRKQLTVGRPPEEQWDLGREEDFLWFDIRVDATAPLVGFVAGGFDYGAGFGGVALENERTDGVPLPFGVAPPRSPSIDVVSATYGQSCGAARDNVKRAVERTCDAQSSCVFRVTTAAFGDPTPGCAKDFRVVYRCGDGPIQSRKLPAQFANGGHVVLDCEHLEDARGVSAPLNISTVDVAPTHPFVQRIQLLAQKGVFPGCGAGFCPEAPLKRSDMAEIIVRAMYGNVDFGYPTVPHFPGDVPSTHPQFRFVQKFRDLEITQGCTADRYCPDETVTRGQMATFLARATYRTDDTPIAAAAYFDDVPPSHLFFRGVQKLKELGITDGCEPRRFCVDDPTTRGQMAVFVARTFYGDETN